MLQYEVLEHRMESEYGVKYHKQDTAHSLVRFVESSKTDLKNLNLMQQTKWVKDRRGRDLLIFTAEYEINWALDKNEGLVLKEFSQMQEF
jgi:peptide chain release factor 3